ncbi:hypothetical protein R6Q59_022726 [Mikania micrantha]
MRVEVDTYMITLGTTVPTVAVSIKLHPNIFIGAVIACGITLKTHGTMYHRAILSKEEYEAIIIRDNVLPGQMILQMRSWSRSWLAHQNSCSKDETCWAYVTRPVSRTGTVLFGVTWIPSSEI